MSKEQLQIADSRKHIKSLEKRELKLLKQLQDTQLARQSSSEALKKAQKRQLKPVHHRMYDTNYQMNLHFDDGLEQMEESPFINIFENGKKISNGAKQKVDTRMN